MITIFLISLELISLNFYQIALIRLFIGGIIGVNSASISIYINSISPKSMIGGTGSMNQLFITIGVTFANLFGLIIPVEVN